MWNQHLLFLLYSVLVTLHHHHRILNKKTTNSGYFGGNFLYLGAFFSVWGKFLWENLKLLQGQILFFPGAIFLVIVNLCFRGKFIFWGLFQFGQYFSWKILNLYFGVKFLKYMKGIFLNYRIIIFYGRQNFIICLALTKNQGHFYQIGL